MFLLHRITQTLHSIHQQFVSCVDYRMVAKESLVVPPNRRDLPANGCMFVSFTSSVYPKSSAIHDKRIQLYSIHVLGVLAQGYWIFQIVSNTRQTHPTVQYSRPRCSCPRLLGIPWLGRRCTTVPKLGHKLCDFLRTRNCLAKLLPAFGGSPPLRGDLHLFITHVQ